MFQKRSQQQPNTVAVLLLVKRLAERNCLAREAKKQAEAQKPLTNTTTDADASATNTPTNTTKQLSNSSTNTVFVILGVGGFILSALGVYYQREAIMRTLGQSQKTPESNTTTVNVVEPPPLNPKEKCGIIKMN